MQHKLKCFLCTGTNKSTPVPLLPPAGQTLYGRVLWNPEQNLNAAYKLQLEKVYLCTGRDGYVPFFDPTGTLYNEGPQYGCIQPNKHLKHRFLLLVQMFMFCFVYSGLWCMFKVIRNARYVCQPEGESHQGAY